ncbi:MAG: hypothetical protein ACRERV_00335 [Methylococcales bacterium]
MKEKQRFDMLKKILEFQAGPGNANERYVGISRVFTPEIPVYSMLGVSRQI